MQDRDINTAVWVHKGFGKDEKNYGASAALSLCGIALRHSRNTEHRRKKRFEKISKTCRFCKEVAKVGLIYLRHNRNTKHRRKKRFEKISKTCRFCKEGAKVGLIYLRHNRNTKHRRKKDLKNFKNLQVLQRSCKGRSDILKAQQKHKTPQEKRFEKTSKTCRFCKEVAKISMIY